MEENKEGSNLPIEVKNKGLLQQPPVIKTIDAVKRFAKIASSSTVGIAGLGMILLGSGPVMAAGAVVSMAGIARLGQNAFMKTEPTLLFGTRKLASGALGIYQDPYNMNLMTRMIGYNKNEKMNMMGVQTLVGLDRYKSILGNSKYELDENGNKIYDQKFSTVTHGINLSSIEYLEKLGYIKIDSIETDFKPDSLEEKAIARNKNEKGEVTSNLIVEELGFGNVEGLKKAAKSVGKRIVTGEKDKSDKKYLMKKATFRLTDKPIDFEELVKYATPSERAKLPKEQRAAAGWFGKMIKSVEKKKVEIVKDATGRPILKYPSRMENVRLVARNIRENNNRKIESSKDVKVDKADKAVEQLKKEQEKFNEMLHEGIVEQPIANVKTQEVITEQDVQMTNDGQDKEME